MTTSCPACRADAPDGARFCPACGARLEAERPGATERKVVTTLFADLVDFTALGERYDPEDVDAALRGYYGLARTIIERFGGVVEKFIGDAVVGLFGVPLAHEDDAERAVRAALELVAHLHELPPIGSERLRVRAAVNTGPALVRLHARPETGEGVLVGDAVNTAARLLAEAPPMGVVVGDATRRLTSRCIAYESMSPCHAKGKAAPVARWSARGPIGRRGIDPDGRELSPLIGREVELGMLTALLDKAIASGAPQIALVTGEAGMGKSRLVRELFGVVDRRPGLLCTWRQGRCPAYGDRLAYWPVREIVSAHIGILQSDESEEVEAKLAHALASSTMSEWLSGRLRPLLGLAAGQTEREESFAAWTGFIEDIARARPTVIVVEDLHWASEPTLAFLGYLVRHVSGVRLLLIGTARPEFLDAHPDAARFASSTTHIELAELTEEASARLVAAIASRGETGLAQEAIARCGGNPLYTEEFVRFMIERRAQEGKGGESAASGAVPTHLPDSLLALIAARLDSLPPDSKTTLSNAAVVGQVFWPGALAAIDDGDVSAVMASLDGLERRGFVRRHADSSFASEPEFTFWHALIRDVAYEQLPRSSRARRHARLAAWIESENGGLDELAEVVAHHYSTAFELADHAGDRSVIRENRAAAVAALARAGDRALRLNVEAATHYYSQALVYAPPESPRHAELQLRLGESLLATRQADAAIEVLEASVRECRASGDRLRVAYALSRLAYAVAFEHRAEAYPICAEAVGMLDPGDARPESADILEMWARHCLWREDLTAVLETTDRALRMHERLGLPLSYMSVGLHGYARTCLGDGGGLDDLRAAMRIAEQRGSSLELYGLRDAYSRCLCITDRPGAVLELLGPWIVESRQHRDLASTAALQRVAGSCLSMCGKWNAALAALVEAEQTLSPERGSIAESELCTTRAAIFTLQGAVEDAEPFAAKFEAIRDSLPDPWPFGYVAAAACRASLGQPESAAALLEDLQAHAAFANEPASLLWWPLAARTAEDVGRPDLARGLAQQALAWAACPSRVRASLAALSAESHRDFPNAAKHYAAAAEAWLAADDPHEVGHAHLGLGRCLMALGKGSEAAAALETARSTFAGLGARPALEVAKSLLHEARASSG